MMSIGVSEPNWLGKLVSKLPWTRIALIIRVNIKQNLLPRANMARGLGARPQPREKSKHPNSVIRTVFPIYFGHSSRALNTLQEEITRWATFPSRYSRLIHSLVPYPKNAFHSTPIYAVFLGFSLLNWKSDCLSSHKGASSGWHSERFLGIVAST